MQTLATTMWSLGLGLLLSSSCPWGPPLGPDQQEAGPEKSDAAQPQRQRSDTSSKHAIIDAYLRCFDSCADQPADERPACHDKCTTKTSAGSGDPPASACPRSCTLAFGSCLAPCGDEHSEDGVASCRRKCQALAEDCVDGCS
jgi:hypothetical protein